MPTKRTLTRSISGGNVSTPTKTKTATFTLKNAFPTIKKQLKDDGIVGSWSSTQNDTGGAKHTFWADKGGKIQEQMTINGDIIYIVPNCK